RRPLDTAAGLVDDVCRVASKYKYNQNAGALQEAMPSQERARVVRPPSEDEGDPYAGRASVASMASMASPPAPEPPRRAAPLVPPAGRAGVDRTQRLGRSGLFTYTVEEGRRVLAIHKSGRMRVVEGPARVWRWGHRFMPMVHHVAHPGEFLIVRYRDGRQEHRVGPAHVWLDPREPLEVEREDALQIASKEAVVVYSEADGAVSRRVVHGPASFVPRPGEWLHTFSWHGSDGGSRGYQKVPKGLVFQKLWMMPDQMYHDVPDVRTSDDAVLTIRLMIFFELVDIERMLATTHDPIGDFVNAATSDLVELIGRQDFDTFKANVDRLNDLAVYRQLTERAGQCGYRIGKVVFRGYGAPPSLQQMHDQAIESRTRLKLERATEQQAQELEDFRLERTLARAGKQRADRSAEVDQELEVGRRRHEAELESERARQLLARAQRALDATLEAERQRTRDAAQRDHLAGLAALGVSLDGFLTQGRADQVLELRGGGTPHVHLEPRRPG
ncbi:MAG: hypothetical protein ACK5U8_20240, partial [Deltaproteobacteria bacterium]